MAIFSVNEIFGPTIQGEGPVCGQRTVFIRFNGCDYRCDWCDSLEAVLPEKIQHHKNLLNTHQIIACLKARQVGGMVTLSGGNPALQKNMPELIDALHVNGYEIAMETQGSIAKEWFADLDWLILSPKPPSSKMKTNWKRLFECLAVAPPNVALKVVVFDDADLEYAYEVHLCNTAVPFYIQVGTQNKGFLGLEGATPPNDNELLWDYRRLVDQVLKDDRFVKAHVLPQLHLLLFGHGRGV